MINILLSLVVAVCMAAQPAQLPTDNAIVTPQGKVSKPGERLPPRPGWRRVIDRGVRDPFKPPRGYPDR